MGFSSPSAPAQSVGYQSQLIRLVGQTQTILIDDSQTGKSYIQHSLAHAELGAPAETQPYERFGQFVIAAQGGIFLKAIAEEAGGGSDAASQEDRLISAAAGATEDIMTVSAGPGLVGQSGYVTIPLRIWFLPTPPNSSGAPDGVYWSYGVSYAAVTGDVETGTPAWEEKKAYSLSNLIFFGIELPLEDGDDLKTSPAMLRVPVTFGTPELFTVVGGISATAPLSPPRGGGGAGGVRRLEMQGRFLLGAPVKVETATGVELAPGTWSVKFATGINYVGLPALRTPSLSVTQAGIASLSYDSPPGLLCQLESWNGSGEWLPLGSLITGDGSPVQQNWSMQGIPKQLFRLRYSLRP